MDLPARNLDGERFLDERSHFRGLRREDFYRHRPDSLRDPHGPTEVRPSTAVQVRFWAHPTRVERERRNTGRGTHGDDSTMAVRLLQGADDRRFGGDPPEAKRETGVRECRR